MSPWANISKFIHLCLGLSGIEFCFTTSSNESCQDGAQEQDDRQAGAPDLRITIVPDESCQDGAQEQDDRHASALDLRITALPDESCQDGAQKQVLLI